ncbi:heavy metal-responsive transcriptional regulator [Nitriliruptoraceae bacterium ZYF776]|jgi:DNA-binding transcriptional MerR regulator|nr:heavy metal-responsive transcriptional regulator [Actinomycetota bacterium]MTV27947.1 heavy metal-responsive transcriptional regulator [Profundirhabdus halotolerans]
MRIGQVADELGINTKTIRYYESIELIPAVPRTPAGYRDYTDEDIDRLEFIRTGRRLGLSLDEIRQVLHLRERGEQPCDYVLDVVHRQLRDIDRHIRELAALRDELHRLLDTAHQPSEAPGNPAPRYCRLVEAAS